MLPKAIETWAHLSMHFTSACIVDEILSTLKDHLWAVVAEWRSPIVRDLFLCRNLMLPVLQAVFLTFNLYLLRTANRYSEKGGLWRALS